MMMVGKLLESCKVQVLKIGARFFNPGIVNINQKISTVDLDGLTSGAGKPDVVTLAKALGGGLPIGAVLARADLAFGPGEHGSTFGGGPVPCAAALAVLDTIEAEGLLANTSAMGALLRDEVARLAPSSALTDIRGDGLLCGFRLPGENATDVVQALLARGVLASTAGPDVVRCTPPFVIGPAEIDEAAKALAAALQDAA